MGDADTPRTKRKIPFFKTIVCAAVALLLWLIFSPRSYHLKDVTKPQTIILLAPSGAEHIQAISLRMEGSIDGAATLASTYDSQSTEVKGVFDLKFPSSDCYTTNYILEYVPKGVTRGKVTIHYKFHDMSILGEFERELSIKIQGR